MPTTRELIADLKDAFPRETIEPSTFRLYVRILADIPTEMLEAVVLDLICTSERFPTVSAIRAAAAERALALPGEAAALEQIASRMRWAKEREGDPPPIHPLVGEALEHVGGWHAFRAADEPGVIRGQFLRLYREIRQRAIRGVQVGELMSGDAPKQLTEGEQDAR